ncbi:MAG: tetratricopeptide repeat protein [Betaproteobacteria bacterium]|nr:tetratricopeptide repeat protein [Betaproteobacteria bacterium]
MRKVPVILISLAFAAPCALAAEKTFRKEARQIVGSAQTQDDARAAALAKARRDALEEAGSWLESTTEVKNMKLVRDDVKTLSAGITSTRVVLEQPFVEGQAVGIRIVAEVRVDTAQLDERIRAFLADRERVAEKKAETARERELYARLAELERRIAMLQTDNPAEKQALRRDVQANSRKLAAQEAYRKGDALWKRTAFSDPKAAIGAFDEAIRLDPDYAAAYLHRGRAYRDLKAYDKALADMNHALRRDPNLPYGYVSRAWAYFFMGDYPRAHADAESELRRSPGLASAHYARGVAKRRLTRGREGAEDIRKACDLRYAPACDEIARAARK